MTDTTESHTDGRHAGPYQRGGFRQWLDCRGENRTLEHQLGAANATCKRLGKALHDCERLVRDLKEQKAGLEERLRIAIEANESNQKLSEPTWCGGGPPVPLTVPQEPVVVENGQLVRRYIADLTPTEVPPLHESPIATHRIPSRPSDVSGETTQTMRITIPSS